MEGYIRVAAATNNLTLGNPMKNAEDIINLLIKAKEKNVNIIVFPELCLTGYTCNEMFRQKKLLDEADKALIYIRSKMPVDLLVAIGTVFRYRGKLYNVIVYLLDGTIIGMVPKRYIPNYSEFYEERYFTEGFEKPEIIEWNFMKFPFGQNILLECKNIDGLTIASEICEDLWVPNPPSTKHALNGANLILNASASNETIGKDVYRRNLVSGQSARTICAYVYASAGEGESTQDLIFSAHNIIAENGTILNESNTLSNDMIIADIDLEKLTAERMRINTFKMNEKDDYFTVSLTLITNSNNDTLRLYPKYPFIPDEETERNYRCERILTMQALGLKKRLLHTKCKNVVIGISGGLDSTLALIVALKAFDMLNLSKKGIIGITMPCFGTTGRTYKNSIKLMEEAGITIKEISIKESVAQHLKDIKQPEHVFDVTYENAQARERTQVLMDIANKENALVIGTGDMSELALGWCTYNGDHMSMYAVNVGIPKTLVKYLVKYYTETTENKKLANVLLDILNKPVSPELLPPDKKRKIKQKTEDKIGPYELHDFFLYYMLRFGYTPKRIYQMAKETFKNDYDNKTILKWLKVFYKRFFSQQFKRSCIPDGPKVGSISLSPRGDLRMPSDMSSDIWIEELNNLS